MTDERWPEPLPRSSPYNAARIAQRLARSWQREGMLHTEASFEIAALLSPRGLTDEQCYIRSDYARGEVPDCGITPPPVDAEHPYAYYAISNPSPVVIPQLDYNPDGTIELVGNQIVYVYEPVRFIGGNPIVDRLIRSFRTRNGLWAITPTSFYSSLFRLCPDGSPVNEPVTWRELPVVARYVKNDWTPTTTWDVHPYEGYAISESPGPFYGYRPGSVIGYVLATDIPVANPLRLGLSNANFPNGQPYGETEFPPELVPVGAVIEGGYGIRIPDGIPAVPVPKTGGVLRVRALGYDYYGVVINGNWHVQTRFEGEVEIGIRKWLGLDVSTAYTFRAYGTSDGISYYEVLVTDNYALSVGPVTFHVDKDAYYTFVIEPELAFDTDLEFTLRSVTIP